MCYAYKLEYTLLCENGPPVPKRQIQDAGSASIQMQFGYYAIRRNAGVMGLAGQNVTGVRSIM